MQCNDCTKKKRKRSECKGVCWVLSCSFYLAGNREGVYIGYVVCWDGPLSAFERKSERDGVIAMFMSE
jgi:hypothetical protein